jgi:endogenous inhibitor of DNA gyrase (YacG/DUF329 family)
MEIICPTCNKSFVYKGGISHYKRNKNHFCSRECQNVKHGMSRRIDREYRYEVWSHASRRARKKDLEFNLTPQDIPEIPEYCPILNIKLEKNNGAGPKDYSPSLDRIDSTKGYIVGNIRIISNRANRIKSDSTFEEIELLYKDYQKLKQDGNI